MADISKMELWGVVTGIVGTVTGVASLCWQILREVVSDKQAVTFTPDAILLGEPRTPMGNGYVINPTKFHVKCTNTGRRPIVLDEIRIIDADSGEQLGKRYLRQYQQMEHARHSDSGGLTLEVEEMRVIEVDLLGDSDHFVPTDQSKGRVEAITSRGKTFRSRQFLFGDVLDLRERPI
jgi:hypothetical protein